ncbi:MAG: LssY C-terminal domain-containing protein [Thermoguttaceae bacterium]|jgi:hypothetical protein
MNVEPTALQSPPPGKRWRRSKHAAAAIAGLLLLYLAVAYLAMPWWWTHYVRRHPSLDDVPGITETRAGIPGDPLNVAFIGTEQELKRIMLAAKWYPADPLTWRSCLRIADASVLKRPYADAPVSNLYLFGRKEDLAFEQPVGRDPRHRHHVRFWQSADVDPDGRPVWVGAAIYDRRVGVSRTTYQITHSTAADIDIERDYLLRCVQETGALAEVYVVTHFHAVLQGRNGGGDPWHTDGGLDVGVIVVKSP